MIKRFTLLREGDGDYSVAGYPNTKSLESTSIGLGVCRKGLFDIFPYLRTKRPAPDKVTVWMADDSEELEFSIECYKEIDKEFGCVGLDVEGQHVCLLLPLQEILDKLVDDEPFYLYAEADHD